MPTCKACDAVLTDREGAWNPETRQHEEFCGRCLKIIIKAEFDDEVDELYNTPYDYSGGDL